jgi:hydrogenase nickel incorporation protein HypA/HybF
MHELSIALSIIEGVEEELAKQESERVEVVHLRLGALAGVVKEALLFSFDMAAAGTRLEGSRLQIEDVPVTIYCAACRSERPAVSVQNMRCAECGTPGCDVRRGTELQVFAIEL